MKLCPCCSGKTFEKCCELVIQNMSASTAEELMRSRYTAYATGNVTYLIETTHSSTRAKFDPIEMDRWSRENAWDKLEVVDVQGGDKRDSNGVVEFKATYVDASGENQTHHERSDFIKEDGTWYYIDGIYPSAKSLKTKPSRNAQCPCGSGKKYKKCCG